jgi:hypothetical protein
MTYIKVAIFDKHEISKQNISNFKIKWIHNDLEIESPKIKFKK